MSFGIEDYRRPDEITELDKHQLVKFLEFYKSEESLAKKKLAIRTSNVKYFFFIFFFLVRSR